MAGSITGVVGQVKWAYYMAAALNGYTVTRTGSTWILRGTVVASDAFKLAQRPLMFVAPTKHGAWRWPIETVTITGGQLEATLGPPCQ